MNIDRIKNSIRNIPDFPKPGIQFKDITTLLQDNIAFKAAIEAFYIAFKDKEIDVIVGIERCVAWRSKRIYSFFDIILVLDVSTNSKNTYQIGIMHRCKRYKISHCRSRSRMFRLQCICMVRDSIWLCSLRNRYAIDRLFYCETFRSQCT